LIRQHLGNQVTKRLVRNFPGRSAFVLRHEPAVVPTIDDLTREADFLGNGLFRHPGRELENDGGSLALLASMCAGRGHSLQHRQFSIREHNRRFFRMVHLIFSQKE